MVQYSGRFLPETTLPKTNSSAMKMGHPKRKRKSIPTIHFQVRTVSFRKGTLLPHGISNFWTFSTPSDSAMQLAQMATLVVPDAAAKKRVGRWKDKSWQVDIWFKIQLVQTRLQCACVIINN